MGRTAGAIACSVRQPEWRAAARPDNEGWDRTAATAADIDRISAAVDVNLRRAGADRAAHVRQATNVSVVDATVGHAAEAGPHPAVILTSDTDDMTRLTPALEGDVRVVGICPRRRGLCGHEMSSAMFARDRRRRMSAVRSYVRAAVAWSRRQQAASVSSSHVAAPASSRSMPRSR